MNLSADVLETELKEEKYRASLQPVMPRQIVKEEKNDYTIYPYHSLSEGRIFQGYDTLADWIVDQKTVVIDGFSGVLWSEVYEGLHAEFKKRKLETKWLFASDYLKSKKEIKTITAPFLGTPGSVWGRKTDLTIHDFFQTEKLSEKPDNSFDINIVIGTGAALFSWETPIIYLDVPKNEIQYRMAAGSITNLGNDRPESSSEMYKRFFFVDWVVLNDFKQQLKDKITVIADTQWGNTLNWMFASDLRKQCRQLSQSVFRPRPWFTPGSWGGQWMKQRLKGLNQDESNYAWSFELIAPEAGLILESSGSLLEISFDWLMLYNNKEILGRHASVFNMEFPIRFDFLDTFDGGNLSIQCHPTVKYIREVFGEKITQDETYYIMDCEKDAKVYLGFQEDINPDEFKQALEHSRDFIKKIDIEKYVRVFPSEKHGLYLIPNGTIHSSGTNNLVLEISATPYIFTFKMYDWLSLGLDGKPRPINIEHGFANLNFDRKGKKVEEELISKPAFLEEGDGWKLIHLPTHKEHFFDVHRIELTSSVNVKTNNGFHLLMLVEGTSIDVQTPDGKYTTFHYAETFVIPASVSEYTLINKGNEPAKVIKAFVKEELTAV